MTYIQAFRINWSASDNKTGERPDGYSFHRTPNAAATYLKVEMDGLPKEILNEFSFPGEGFRQPLAAIPVVVPIDSRLGRALMDSDSVRVVRALNDEAGELYKEAQNFKPQGAPVTVEYSQLFVRPDEAAAIARGRGRAQAAQTPVQTLQAG